MTIQDFVTGFIFPHENEYKNGKVVAEHVKNDSGGTTKYGIDQRSHPTVDIENLTADGALKIYLEEWNLSLANTLKAPLSFAFFDTEVNSGARQSLICLQRTLNVNDDGIFGPHTIKAMLEVPDPINLAVNFLQHRVKFYHKLVNQNPAKYGGFLKGWINRTTELGTFLKLR